MIIIALTMSIIVIIKEKYWYIDPGMPGGAAHPSKQPLVEPLAKRDRQVLVPDHRLQRPPVVVGGNGGGGGGGGRRAGGGVRWWVVGVVLVLASASVLELVVVMKSRDVFDTVIVHTVGVAVVRLKVCDRLGWAVG